ncbi:hypothetical protein Moror_15683 [Moniliophthora roreri MCA 2997]|uniref:RNase H type-1 domain-containing protein n=1 Tax=Moniliophthora roreri (strain MCA 2997) TaxID=1381753 RepID=V2W3X8_MONRO|nr:hypothetical protein Moror_15683 [Moniliophthora roreri MCA 2997]
MMRLSPITLLKTPGQENHILWVSNGSMIPTAASILDQKNVTAAVMGQLSCALRIEGVSTNILHREMMGLIMSAVLSEDKHCGKHMVLYSDHLNAVHITNDSLLDIDNMQLCHLNGCSYYRWLLHLLRRQPNTSLSYVKAHTDDPTPPSLLNFAADHYALRAQKVHTFILPAPVSTFFMDEYTFHYGPHGWYEGNIQILTKALIEQRLAQDLVKGYNL